MFPLSLSLQQCEDIYGLKASSIAANIDYTNEYYGISNYTTTFQNSAPPRAGGRDIQGSNIVFPNGSIDPWHALGVLNTTVEGITPIFITGTSHCADMLPSSPYDPPGLTAARQQIAALIKTWLN